MKPRHRVSPAAIALIKRFEGLRLTAARLDDGRWTIGYGHTRSAREGASISEADAEALLAYDLIDVEAALNDWAFTPLTQNQFDALASFAFNIGLDGFRHSSVLRRINEGALLQAACAMEMWRKADFEGERIVIDALVRRRATEKALFLTPEDGFVAAPSAVLPPKMDYDVGAAVPRVRPTELRTNLEGGAASPLRTSVPAADDGKATPTERAAAAVSARLQSILPVEEPEDAEPGPREAAAAAALAMLEPGPFPGEPPAEPFDAPVRPEPREAPVPAHDVVRAIFEQTREEPERSSFTPLLILAGIGMVMFAGGLYWAFTSRPSGGLMGSTGLGLILGFLGIACVASAVYFLLEKLGGAKD